MVYLHFEKLGLTGIANIGSYGKFQLVIKHYSCIYSINSLMANGGEAAEHLYLMVCEEFNEVMLVGYINATNTGTALSQNYKPVP